MESGTIKLNEKNWMSYCIESNCWGGLLDVTMQHGEYYDGSLERLLGEYRGQINQACKSGSISWQLDNGTKFWSMSGHLLDEEGPQGRKRKKFMQRKVQS